MWLRMGWSEHSFCEVCFQQVHPRAEPPLPLRVQFALTTDSLQGGRNSLRSLLVVEEGTEALKGQAAGPGPTGRAEAGTLSSLLPGQQLRAAPCVPCTPRERSERFPARALEAQILASFQSNPSSFANLFISFSPLLTLPGAEMSLDPH